MISLTHNFLFIHIPKTAGNSIQNVLKQYSDDSILRLSPVHDGIETYALRSGRYELRKHSRLVDYKKEIAPDIFDKMFKFTCVRNPWERAISHYFTPHRGKVLWNRDDFAQWVLHVPLVSEFLALGSRDSAESGVFGNMDYIMKLESLDADFEKVCELIGIPYEPLQVRNKANRDNYRQYYDDELVELVRSRFADEIERFGYEYEAV